MLDLTLLRILKHKEHYDRIVPNLPAGALDPKTMAVIADFGAYLKETGHPVVKMGAFKTYFFNFRHKSLTTAQKKYYDQMIDKLDKSVDDATVRVMANKLIELGFATDVANDAQSYHRGDEIDIIHSIGLKHEQAKVNIMTGNIEELYVSDNIEDLLDEDKNLSGLRFRLACLRDNLRPLRSGDLVLACGRPDTGKTTFLCSELVDLVHSLSDDAPVIWFNNEGKGNRIIKRLYQAFLGCTVTELLQLQEEGVLHDKYISAYGPRVRVIDCHDWDTLMVEQVIADTGPGLVIMDMIDNLIFKGDLRMAKGNARTDEVLEAQYQWARKLGVKYDHPVIATSQVSAAAEDSNDVSCYPHMHMLKDSRTGKQGAADLMIMIGRSQSPECANDRFISTPKNKLGLDDKPVYIKQQVNFDGARARYMDPIV